MKITHLLIPTAPVSQRPGLAGSEHSCTFFAGPCRNVPDTTQDCKTCLSFQALFQGFLFLKKTSQNICHSTFKDLEMHFLYDFSNRIFIWLFSNLLVMFLGDKACLCVLQFQLSGLWTNNSYNGCQQSVYTRNFCKQMRTQFYVIYYNRLFSQQLHYNFLSHC